MTENQRAILERTAADLDELARERQGEVHQRLADYAARLRMVLRHDAPTITGQPVRPYDRRRRA